MHLEGLLENEGRDKDEEESVDEASQHLGARVAGDVVSLEDRSSLVGDSH
jgi:hypothetical protein